jgi:hypothetical protein
MSQEQVHRSRSSKVNSQLKDISAHPVNTGDLHGNTKYGWCRLLSPRDSWVSAGLEDEFKNVLVTEAAGIVEGDFLGLGAAAILAWWSKKLIGVPTSFKEDFQKVEKLRAVTCKDVLGMTFCLTGG